ncbi:MULTISPECIES: nuclear transport factor 2 family protein [Maribacter]|uniref:Nuclear transport factor 2 family protein n=1 Tax=Maribacter flavus TaxID=1658664 RepID=A0ABU7IMZ8_9FLAO|nr:MULTISPECIES: nuclear transport factor 2 family protein [Maribacter]MDC6406143.1 nuclear transport factor 2 family protein [Maribacter sp. PR66]MEE1974186.1 nuclear transport factor 2 family protein [Maribacter flavus]
MKYLFYFVIIWIVLVYSCNETEKTSDTINIQELSQEQVEQEVWDAIKGRFISWKENDFETYMAYHHPDWKKWESRKNELTTKEGMAKFWEIMKTEEECLEMEVTPIEIEILDSGKSAIAHYTHTETFTYYGEDTPDGLTKGNTFRGTLRWSDFMVKENGKWLVIGGHRDMSMPEGKLVQVND